jgi:protein tyrosine phosphatase (PTP) superfamily phosphohydrolase (DUF442 family)
VRVLTSALRTRGADERSEDLIMIGVIILYVLASAGIAWWLYRLASSCTTRRRRMAIPVALTFAAGVCLWGWLNPTVLASVAGGVEGEVRSGGAQFIFGPYPDRGRLESLKRDGFTAVISLQHPAVLPFEPPGIADEQRHTAELGLPFIHAPMVPWISANEESLNKIRAVAREGKGKYYVHCGLGRDRVNVVRRMLETEGTRVADGEGMRKARTFRDRKNDRRGPLERGDFSEIDRDVWLIPYPNQHELFANMLSGQVAHVALLLDPQHGEQRPWIDESTRLFTQFEVPYSLEPLTPHDTARAQAIVTKLGGLPRPLVVIVPYTAPRGPTDVADTFIAAFTAGNRTH